MARKKLPQSEVEICNRLRFAREQVLGITQQACADTIGIDRSTYANYEACRTSLRFEVALRFCRQMVISEEWLATGKHDAFWRALESASDTHWIKLWKGFDQHASMRQCVDLWSDPVSRHIPPGALFSEAYSNALGPRYAIRVAESYGPTVSLSEADKPETAINFVKATVERHFAILIRQSELNGTVPADGWLPYVEWTLHAADQVFRYMAVRTPLGELDFSFPGRSDLHGFDDLVKLQPVTLTHLLNELRSLTEPSGKKAELAAFLKTSPSGLSHWLSGNRQPGGEITLQMLEWVQAQKAKTKSATEVAAPVAQRTRTRKSSHEKPSPSP